MNFFHNALAVLSFKSVKLILIASFNKTNGALEGRKNTFKNASVLVFFYLVLVMGIVCVMDTGTAQ